MRVRKLLAKPKVVTKAGEWKTGKMSRTAFPLSRSRSFVLGSNWSWRVDILTVDGSELRLLTAFEPSKQSFLSWLSLKRGDSHVVLARLEFHGHEPGIHAHASCDTDLHDIPAGVVKPYGTRRAPRYGKRHRRIVYEMTETTALSTAFRFFKVSGAEGGML
jgi:hypothetical protein